jgi:hypothetical protein
MSSIEPSMSGFVLPIQLCWSVRLRTMQQQKFVADLIISLLYSGVCNFTNVVDNVVRPTCVCYDPNDTSEACSASLIPNGKFLDDSSGLFDPLIKVFVDHPDAWTTASWVRTFSHSDFSTLFLLTLQRSIININVIP